MLSAAVLRDMERYINSRKEGDTYHLSMPHAMSYQVSSELEDFVNARKKPAFTQTLLSMIDQRQLRDSQVYTRAGLDRRHFSKIRSTPGYRPGKPTVVALALALELNRKEADELLASAGYALSDSDESDLVIAYCIDYGIYCLHRVNYALAHFGQETIGAIK